MTGLGGRLDTTNLIAAPAVTAITPVSMDHQSFLGDSLAQIAADNRQLYKAYLMKEQLREVFKAKGEHGKALLAGLIAWCRRCRIPEFAALAKTLARFRDLIWNALDHAVSSGRAEGINTQLAALTARARGFHSAEAFIAMAELTCGGLCPDLPGR